jgi:hypothetical protein
LKRPTSSRPTSRPTPPSRSRTPPSAPPPLANGADAEEGEIALYPPQPATTQQNMSATARLHLTSISGLLWHPECQELQQQSLRQQQVTVNSQHAQHDSLMAC